jgi:hypothetical protein
VLVRLSSLRGVNLNLFDFDYDLTWAGFFLGPDEDVYGRYGGRDAETPDGRMSLAGLRHALERALAIHRSRPARRTAPVRRPVRTVDEYPAAARRQPGSCIHCHHVYDFRREARQAAGTWRTDDLWVYPLPENVGLTLAVDEGDRVAAVAKGSAAARAGLRTGDRLTAVNGIAVASQADVQYGLHSAPGRGKIVIAWRRDGKPLTGSLPLADGWRRTDLSWRWSLVGLEPSPWVYGDDLTAAEKKRLGLPERRLAFYQGPFLTEPARRAGFRANDVIIGVDGKALDLSARQFQAFVKLNYKVGDRVTYNILRDGRRLDVPLTLVARPPE